MFVIRYTTRECGKASCELFITSTTITKIRVTAEKKCSSCTLGAFCEAIIWHRTAWDQCSTIPSCLFPFLYISLFHTISQTQTHMHIHTGAHTHTHSVYHPNGTPTLLEFIWTVLFVICLWALCSPLRITLHSLHHHSLWCWKRKSNNRREQQWRSRLISYYLCRLKSEAACMCNPVFQC